LVIGRWSLANPFKLVCEQPTTKGQRPTIESMTLRRMKTYTGGQGYVYQYYFVGKRLALADAPEAPASEYIFDVTSDRKTMFTVSVFLPDDVLRDWAGKHGRVLNDAEQYGAVKMRLFQAFDEIEDMMASRRLLVARESLDAATKTLGLE
jgi:hypothetical protein